MGVFFNAISRPPHPPPLLPLSFMTVRVGDAIEHRVQDHDKPGARLREAATAAQARGLRVRPVADGWPGNCRLHTRGTSHPPPQSPPHAPYPAAPPPHALTHTDGSHKRRFRKGILRQVETFINNMRKKIVMIAKWLEVSLLGVGTVLNLGRDAWSMAK